MGRNISRRSTNNDRLSSKILIRRSFWSKYKLSLNLANNDGFVIKNGKQFSGVVWQRVTSRIKKLLPAATEGEGVERYFYIETDVTHFSEDKEMQMILKHLLHKHRNTFKRFACIKTHRGCTKLKLDTDPIYLSFRRGSPRRGRMEQNSMSRLVDLSVLEQSVSASAAKNFLVPIKDGSMKVKINCLCAQQCTRD